MVGKSSSVFDAHVALLCEGDQSGHEAFILGRWADRVFPTSRRVKVFPCGTGDALFGMADAYGRQNRICVLEDRDFRSPDEAQSDCVSLEKSRRKRAVNLVAWRTLARNEIENYLLEPACLHPVLTEVFGCVVADIEAALDEVLASLVPYQALQAAQYRARKRWTGTDPSASLPNNLISKPEWKSSDALAAPNVDLLREKLVHNAQALETRSSGRLQGSAVTVDFDSVYAMWQSVRRTHAAWRIDWAGKEVLAHLLMLLAARFGLPMPDGSATRERLDFKPLKQADRGLLYRARLESLLHPELDRSFLRMLEAAPASDAIASEFAELEKLIREWRDAPAAA